MNGEQWHEIEKILLEALRLRADERQACGEDPGRLRTVESLLALDGEAEDFLEPPRHSPSV